MVPRAVAHATAALRTLWTNCSCVSPASLTALPLPRRASSEAGEPGTRSTRHTRACRQETELGVAVRHANVGGNRSAPAAGDPCRTDALLGLLVPLGLEAQ